MSLIGAYILSDHQWLALATPQTALAVQNFWVMAARPRIVRRLVR
jgi:hypothetical protein